MILLKMRDQKQKQEKFQGIKSRRIFLEELEREVDIFKMIKNIFNPS